MDATNVPLQFLECIESMKNEVKRKIGTRRHLRAMYVEGGDLRDVMTPRATAHGMSRCVRKGEE